MKKDDLIFLTVIERYIICARSSHIYMKLCPVLKKCKSKILTVCGESLRQVIYLVYILYSKQVLDSNFVLDDQREII